MRMSMKYSFLEIADRNSSRLEDWHFRDTIRKIRDITLFLLKRDCVP